MSREKQIEEMSTLIYENRPIKDIWNEEADSIAETLYNEGYRKQSEGEWIRREKIQGKITPEAVCSNCGREVVYQVIDNKWEFENYCPHCGTKMKGGAE